MLYRFKSNLFVPGHKMHNLEDVQRTDVNALIIDLEDGCPDDLKKEAREDLINNFKDGNKFSKTFIITFSSFTKSRPNDKVVMT